MLSMGNCDYATSANMNDYKKLPSDLTLSLPLFLEDKRTLNNNKWSKRAPGPIPWRTSTKNQGKKELCFLYLFRQWSNLSLWRSHTFFLVNLHCTTAGQRSPTISSTSFYLGPAISCLIQTSSRHRVGEHLKTLRPWSHQYIISKFTNSSPPPLAVLLAVPRHPVRAAEYHVEDVGRHQDAGHQQKHDPPTTDTAL